MRFFKWVCLVSSGVLAVDRDYYDVLGVPKSATAEQIRKAYKKLSKQYHPDINKTPEASNKFSDIAEAYEKLSNPKERQMYDRYGKDGPPEPARTSIFDLFGFGASHQRRTPQDHSQKAADTVLRLYTTLSQLYHGGHISLAYTRLVPCLNVDECIEDRPECAAAGIKVVITRPQPHYVMQQQMHDSSCLSAGKAYAGDARCRKQCPEGMFESRTNSLDGYIRPGMGDGDTIKFADAGSADKIFEEPGDLVLEIVTEREDELFIRDAHDNLHTQLYITLEESLLGFKTVLPHVSGKSVTIDKRGSVTPDGSIVTVRGQGMPKRGTDGTHFGNLLVKIRVRYPSDPFDRAQKTKIEEAFAPIKRWAQVRMPNVATS